MSKENKPSAEALAAYIADALRADPAAEKAFRANPAKFLEEKSGQPVPQGVRIEVHENSDTVWHIPLGAKAGPIDEVNLDTVAGGIGAPIFTSPHGDPSGLNPGPLGLQNRPGVSHTGNKPK